MAGTLAGKPVDPLRHAGLSRWRGIKQVPEDYVMRLIRQISAALAGIIAKQKGGNLVEAREELATTCVLTIGLSLAQIKQLSPEAVAELLKKTGASRHLRAVTLAELLLLDA